MYLCASPSPRLLVGKIRSIDSPRSNAATRNRSRMGLCRRQKATSGPLSKRSTWSWRQETIRALLLRNGLGSRVNVHTYLTIAHCTQHAQCCRLELHTPSQHQGSLTTWDIALQHARPLRKHRTRHRPVGKNQQTFFTRPQAPPPSPPHTHPWSGGLNDGICGGVCMTKALEPLWKAA
jgi:hypothetical protein